MSVHVIQQYAYKRQQVSLSHGQSYSDVYSPTQNNQPIIMILVKKTEYPQLTR